MPKVNEHNKQLLELCVAGGPIDDIEQLLDQGADVNTKDLHDHKYLRGDKEGTGDGCTDGCTTLLDFAQVQEPIV